MKKIVFGVVFICSCTDAYAGFTDLSALYRANCIGFNESVSWDLTKQHYLATYSAHKSGFNLWRLYEYK